MDRCQAAVFELLTEIDEICRARNIRYYLHADSVIIAQNGGSYPRDRFAVNIEMPAQDALRFIDVVERLQLSDRAIESMANSENIPCLNFRYVNTNSIYMPFGHAQKHGLKGIAINILIIRGHIADKKQQERFSLLELGEELKCDKVSRNTMNPRQRKAANLVGIYHKLLTRRRFRKKLFNDALKAYALNEGEGGWVRKSYGNSRRYSASYFEKEQSIAIIEGHEFLTFPNQIAYVRKWYGDNWKRCRFGVATNKALVMDNRITYDEFKEALEAEGISISKSVDLHKRTLDAVGKRKGYTKDKLRLKNTARNVYYNFEAEDYYQHRKMRIEELMRNDAILEVDAMLDKYRRVTAANARYDNEYKFAPDVVVEAEEWVQQHKEGNPISWDERYK